MPDDRYYWRETERFRRWREHRLIGIFLAHEAWQQRVDCLVLKRPVLRTVLHVDRYLRPTRIWSFLKDIEPWFPFYKIFYYGRHMGIHSVYVSRRPVAKFIPEADGKMTTEELIASMKRGRPRTAILTLGTLKGRNEVERYWEGIVSGAELTRIEAAETARREEEEAHILPKNLPSYAKSTPPELLVVCFCQCSARWGKLNKPNPGITIIRKAERGEYVATCLRCGREVYSNLRWERPALGKRDVRICKSLCRA